MTREHKLALIIGFSLILIVAILLTDHLSPAQSGELDGGMPMASLHGSNGSLRTELPQGSMFAGNRAADALGDDEFSMLEESEFDLGLTESLGAPLQGTSGAGTRAQRNILQLQPPKYAMRADTVDASELDASLDDGEHLVIEMGREIPESTGSNASLPTGERRTYVVRSGDTLYGIARHFYRDGEKASLIANHNTDLIPDGSTIHAGDVLVIPYLPGERPVNSNSAQPEGAPSQPANAAAPRTYVIKSGDTLMDISSEFFGTVKRWQDILEANRDVITNPDVLIEGREILIPAE